MSFGFGIGDFLAVIQLTNSIRKSFKYAPAEFKEISTDVKTLSHTLQDVEVALAEREPSPREKKDLQGIADSCREVLEDVNKVLDSFRELGPRARGVGRLVVRVKDRLIWDQSKTEEFRQRITSSTTQLNAFNSRFIRNQVTTLLRYQEGQLHNTALDWLTPLDYALQHASLSNQRVAGSGIWFLESTAFECWCEEKGKKLLCQGMRGAGKTMLTSIVIDRLIAQHADDRSVGIAYIYFGFLKLNDQEVSDIFASLLKQFAQRRTELPASVKSLFDKHEKRTRPSFDDISTAIQSTTAEFSRIFIVVDALDECPDSFREKFISEIFSLQPKCGANIFMTSRPLEKIICKFSKEETKEIRATDEDLELYIEAHINSLPQFLLAPIFLESLEDKLTINALKRALRDWAAQNQEEPGEHRSETQKAATLRSLYEEAMARIQSQKPGFRDLANNVLAWITHARGQLTAPELQHALSTMTTETVRFSKEDLYQVEDMVSACAGLVAVDIENFESGFCHSDDDFKKRLGEYPFYGYAARNWGHHARELLNGMNTEMEKSTEELVDRILAKENKAKLSGCVQAMMAFQRYKNFSQEVPKGMTGLHVAAYFGLLGAVTKLAQTPDAWDATDTYGRTPLSWAAQRGNADVVNLLLEKGADPNTRATATFMHQCTPLWFAARNGHDATVERLLKVQRIEADAKGTDGQTPLSIAARNGHDAVVKRLIEHPEVDINSKDNNGRTPLSWAAGNGHETVVAWLLEKQANINEGDKGGRTPLSFAAENGREEIVKTLLDKAEVTDDQRKEASEYAAKNGHQAIAEFLGRGGAC
ncbi:hypothetical protein VTH82DRAFT_4923 [Thermothelomyces myriococcoides]